MPLLVLAHAAPLIAGGGLSYGTPGLFRQSPLQTDEIIAGKARLRILSADDPGKAPVRRVA